MSLKTTVKFNAVNNLSDARYGAGMGVSLLGFCLDTDRPKSIDLSKLGAIANWVAGVQIVFEFDTFNTDIFEQARQVAVPHFVQVADIEDWDLLEKTSLLIIHKIKFDPEAHTLTELVTNSPARYVLLEANADVDLMEYVQELTLLCTTKKICISWGIEKENIAAILDQISPWAIAIEGGEEDRPGIKSFDEMDEILGMIEEEY